MANWGKAIAGLGEGLATGIRGQAEFDQRRRADELAEKWRQKHFDLAVENRDYARKRDDILDARYAEGIAREDQIRTEDRDRALADATTAHERELEKIRLRNEYKVKAAAATGGSGGKSAAGYMKGMGDRIDNAFTTMGRQPTPKELEANPLAEAAPDVVDRLGAGFVKSRVHQHAVAEEAAGQKPTGIINISTVDAMMQEVAALESAYAVAGEEPPPVQTLIGKLIATGHYAVAPVVIQNALQQGVVTPEEAEVAEKNVAEGANGEYIPPEEEIATAGPTPSGREGQSPRTPAGTPPLPPPLPPPPGTAPTDAGTTETPPTETPPDTPDAPTGSWAQRVFGDAWQRYGDTLRELRGATPEDATASGNEALRIIREGTREPIRDPEGARRIRENVGAAVESVQAETARFAEQLGIDSGTAARIVDSVVGEVSRFGEQLGVEGVPDVVRDAAERTVEVIRGVPEGVGRTVEGVQRDAATVREDLGRFADQVAAAAGRVANVPAALVADFRAAVDERNRAYNESRPPEDAQTRGVARQPDSGPGEAVARRGAQVRSAAERLGGTVGARAERLGENVGKEVDRLERGVDAGLGAIGRGAGAVVDATGAVVEGTERAARNLPGQAVSAAERLGRPVVGAIQDTARGVGERAGRLGENIGKEAGRVAGAVGERAETVREGVETAERELDEAVRTLREYFDDADARTKAAFERLAANVGKEAGRVSGSAASRFARIGGVGRRAGQELEEVRQMLRERLANAPQAVKDAFARLAAVPTPYDNDGGGAEGGRPFREMGTRGDADRAGFLADRHPTVHGRWVRDDTTPGTPQDPGVFERAQSAADRFAGRDMAVKQLWPTWSRETTSKALYAWTDKDWNERGGTAYIPTHKGEAAAVGALGHETLHHMVKTGKLSDSDMDLLVDKADRYWVARFNIKDRYDSGRIEEATAEALAERAVERFDRGEKEAPARDRTGPRTAEDVLDDILDGLMRAEDVKQTKFKNTVRRLNDAIWSTPGDADNEDLDSYFAAAWNIRLRLTWMLRQKDIGDDVKAWLDNEIDEAERSGEPFPKHLMDAWNRDIAKKSAPGHKWWLAYKDR